MREASKPWRQAKEEGSSFAKLGHTKSWSRIWKIKVTLGKIVGFHQNHKCLRRESMYAYMCLCVHVCLCVWAHLEGCVHVEAEVIHTGCSLLVSSIYYWARSSPSQVRCQAGQQTLGSTFLCPPSTLSGFLCEFWGSKCRSSCLHCEHSAHWAISLVQQ